MKVSIIVPVYNVEKYLGKCLQSLVEQTLSDIEIIVVNDGSTDGSQTVINKYKQKYPNKIISVEKKNGGLSDARNCGLSLAKSEYIGFVDGDDYVDFNMYELLYEKAKLTGADIVECNLHHTYSNREDTEIIEKYYDKQELIAFGCSVAWNKIYKREWLINTGVKFPKGINHEDIDFFVLLVPYINKIEYIDEACVHYIQRENSINNSKTEKLLDIHKIFEHLNKEYEQRNLKHNYGVALEALAIRIFLGSALGRFCKIQDTKLRNAVIKENWAFLNKNYPCWKNNKIIKKLNGIKKIYYINCNYYIYQIMALTLVIKNRIGRL